MGHIAFHRDGTCICHIHNQSHTSNLGTFFAQKLKFGTLHPDLNLQLCARVAPKSYPGVGQGVSVLVYIDVYSRISLGGYNF